MEERHMPSDLAVHPLDRAPLSSGEASAIPAVRTRTATVSVGGRVLDWRQALGGGLIVLGIIGILVAWFQIAGTAEVWKQMPYLASGGVGGAALIAIGITLVVAYEHASDRAALEQLMDRFDSLEARLPGGPPAARNGGATDRDALLDRLAALESALATLQQAPTRAKPVTRAANGRRRG
jgi:hypothetical protein